MAPSRRMLRWAGYMLALPMVVLVACREQPTASSRSAAAPRATATSWGSFYVTGEPVPDPIPLNELFGLSVHVYEAGDHNRPVADTSIAVSARMPEHNHGTNLEPKVTSTGDGSFRVEGMLFHMPGRWELYVDVTRAIEMERATFEVVLD